MRDTATLFIASNTVCRLAVRTCRGHLEPCVSRRNVGVFLQHTATSALCVLSSSDTRLLHHLHGSNDYSGDTEQNEQVGFHSYTSWPRTSRALAQKGMWSFSEM